MPSDNRVSSCIFSADARNTGGGGSSNWLARNRLTWPHHASGIGSAGTAGYVPATVTSTTTGTGGGGGAGTPGGGGGVGSAFGPMRKRVPGFKSSDRA